MAVLCNRKGKTSFSAWFWQSSHNVENEEMANLTVKNKGKEKKTVLGHEKHKQLGEAQSFCKCAHHC